MGSNKRKKVSSPVGTHPPPFTNELIYIMQHSDPNENLKTVSPFLIERVINNAIKGQLKKLNKLKTGLVLIHLDNQDQIPALLSITSLQDQVPVIITPHKTLNFAQGVIRCWEFDGMSDDNIAQDLKEQNVTHVRRLTKSPPTFPSTRPPAFVCQFSNSQLPEYITISSKQYPLALYYRPPLRCYNCQMYGHRTPCVRPRICPKCAEPHEKPDNDAECSRPTKCAVCSADDHDVRSTSCPKFRSELKTIRFATLENVSIPEARKILGKPKNTLQAGVSYSRVTANSSSLVPPHHDSFPPLTDSTPIIPIIPSTSSESHSQFSSTPRPPRNPNPPVPCSTCSVLLPAVQQLTEQVKLLTEQGNNLVKLVTTLLTSLNPQLQVAPSPVSPPSINEQQPPARPTPTPTEMRPPQVQVPSIPAPTNPPPLTPRPSPHPPASHSPYPPTTLPHPVYPTSFAVPYSPYPTFSPYPVYSHTMNVAHMSPTPSPQCSPQSSSPRPLPPSTLPLIAQPVSPPLLCTKQNPLSSPSDTSSPASMDIQ